MITTDTGAKKIEGTDNWRQIFGAHNDSVDAYDANVAALQDALGIVVNGNQSAVAASTGQFIILKNSSIVDSGDVMLADGLYTATKAIPANTVIDKTYLTADANGGLNSLNSKLASIVGTSWFAKGSKTISAKVGDIISLHNGGSNFTFMIENNNFSTLVTFGNPSSVTVSVNTSASTVTINNQWKDIYMTVYKFNFE